MPRQFLRNGLVLLIAAVFCTACSLAPSTTAALPPGKGSIPTVTLDDTSPANLDFAMSISIDQLDLPNPTVMTIGAQFMYNNSLVRFIKGEKLVCGGTTIPTMYGQAYVTSKIPPAGTIVNCTYSSPQGQATFSYAVPEQPKILSPAPGVTIVRSKQTALTVTIVPTCTDDGVGILIGNSGRGAGVASDKGCSPQQTVDTTGLSPGPGILGFGEGEQINEVTNNPGFHSFYLRFNSNAVIPVTWK